MSENKPIMIQGRIVWGSNFFKGNPQTMFGTNTPKLNKKGEQSIQYGFGLAVPKANCAEIWAKMYEEAYRIYPSRQLPPAFAFKYKDGDTDIDDKGFPYSKREGYAGCLVFACTQYMPIKWFKYEGGNNILINEGIKCGDYVNVQLSVEGHPPEGQGKPGLYLNPMAVQFLGFGQEIINSPSGDQIFGVQAPVMPAGASATPLAPQPGQMLVPQQQFAPPPMQPQQQFVPPAAPQPHYAVLPPQHQPPAYQPQGGGPVYPTVPQPGVPQGQQFAPPAPGGYPQMPVPGQR